VRRIALVAAVLAGLVGGAVAPPAARASCGFIVVWHDRAYSGYWGRGQVDARPDAVIHGAEEPGCNDTVGADEHPTAVPARKIAGIPPSVAILSGGEPLVAYGYFPGVPGFPLDAGGPPADETAGCRLGGPVRLTGPADVGLGAIGVHVNQSTVHLHHLLRGSAQVFIDARTSFDGLQRDGFPYLGQGQLVRVDARFCKVPGSIGTKIVARRIAAAGPIVPPSTAETVLGPDWRGRPGLISRATGGHSRAAYAAVGLLVAVAALLGARRRSPWSGTG
jgi:hypothetical protein